MELLSGMALSWMTFSTFPFPISTNHPTRRNGETTPVSLVTTGHSGAWIRHAAKSFERRSLLCNRTGLRLREQPLRLFQQELGVREWFVADILPADETVTVDQKRTVKFHVLEVVVTAVFFEDVKAPHRRQA